MECQGFTELVKTLSQSELDELLEVAALEELQRSERLREQRKSVEMSASPTLTRS